MLGTTALTAAYAAAPAAAQPEAGERAAIRIAQADRSSFDIPAQPLAGALIAFGQQSGLQVTVDSAILDGLASQPLAGLLTAQEALQRLLAGTGIVWRFSDARTVALERPPGASGVLTLQPVTVEGRQAGASRFGDTPQEPRGFKADYQASATKSPLALRETPQAVSVVTRDSIEARQVRDVTTALELTAGVTSGRSSGGGLFAGPSPRVSDQYSLRGQRLAGDRDVRIDGFAAGSNRVDFDLAAFERVEVIKGPSSMLYGQGSVGGFINLVAKRPQPEFAAGVSVQAGSYESYRGEADVTGTLIPGQRLYGRAIAAYEDNGSFIDGVESRRTVFAPSLEAEIGERTRALLQVQYLDDDFVPGLGIPLRLDGSELKIPNIPRSFYFGVPPTEESTTDSIHTSLRVDHELADRWLATLALHTSRNDRRGLADNYGYGFYGDGNTYLFAASVEHENDTWAGELRVDGRFDAFGREHRLLVGVEQNRIKTVSRSAYTYVGAANIYDGDFADAGTVPAGQLPITFSVHDQTRNRALYAQFMLSVSERTRVLGGVRHDRAKQYAFNDFARTRDEKADEATTYRLGVTHDLTDRITAYAIYAQSFNPVSDSSRSGAILDPETGEGYEAGLKTEWFGGRLGATLAVYRQELDNRPIPDPNNGPGEFFSVSGGLQRVDGIELEVAGSPLPGLTVGGAATWLDSEFIDPADPNFGLTPDETVRRQASLYASYEIQQGSFQGLGFGATAVMVGDRIAIGGGVNRFVDGYERVDLHGYYKGLPGWEFSVLLRNLFDETYVERANGAFAYGHYLGAPRALLARAKVEF